MHGLVKKGDVQDARTFDKIGLDMTLLMSDPSKTAAPAQSFCVESSCATQALHVIPMLRTYVNMIAVALIGTLTALLHTAASGFHFSFLEIGLPCSKTV